MDNNIPPWFYTHIVDIIDNNCNVIILTCQDCNHSSLFKSGLLLELWNSFSEKCECGGELTLTSSRVITKDI